VINKPSKINYFFAHGFKIATWGTALLLGILTVWFYWSFSLSGVIAVFAALLFGWILGGVILWPLLFAIGNKLNGAPFRKGDLVRILVGQHRDNIARVYDVWTSRNQVRVELGEEAEQKMKDIFSFTEVCRETKTAEQ